MIRQIFENIDLGFSFITKDLEVKNPNSLFIKYFGNSGLSPRSLITDVIPETFGLEKIFSEVMNNERNQFKLYNIRRSSEEKGEIFYDLHILPTNDNNNPLMLLTQDVTAETLRHKKIIQKQNELRLTESLSENNIDEKFIDDAIIGKSSHIKTIKQIIKKIAGYDNLTVLITGESGTGKTLIAKVLHYTAGDEEKPFVAINCASIPETLLESELFGHVKGAFTNATKDKKGLVEEADNGTLFLDEIGEMSPTLQAKLLSFLEDRQFRPIGDTKTRKADVRVIAATNKNLAKLVEEKAFREDLYYRLNVVRIDMPPLREMKEDLREIAENFIEIFNIKFEKSVDGFTEDAEKILASHSWPGNVRELRNVIERSMVFTEGDKIRAENVKLDPVNTPLQSPLQNLDSDTLVKDFSLPKGGISLVELEKKILLEALEATDWNQSKAAKLLRISREKLRYRIEKYKLK